jgi:hypothetical protein
MKHLIGTSGCCTKPVAACKNDTDPQCRLFYALLGSRDQHLVRVSWASFNAFYSRSSYRLITLVRILVLPPLSASIPGSQDFRFIGLAGFIN